MHSEVEVAQSCPTLYNPMDYMAHGILQAKILEWIAIPFSSGSFQPRIQPGSPRLQVDSLLSEIPGKPYWNALLFPPPGHLPNPGIEPRSPTLQVDSLPAARSAKKCFVEHSNLRQGVIPFRWYFV